MNNVDAVKTPEKIELIEIMLLKHGNQDYCDVFKLGINVAFRISDLLSIEYSSIDKANRLLVIKEGKTGKTRTVRLNKTALEVINRREATHPLDRYLFQSHGIRGRAACKPMNRSAVARKFQEIGSIVGIALGTHSMRKTRGYMMFKAGVSIEQICKVLNHSNPATTLAYIGITEENTLQTYDDFEL